MASDMMKEKFMSNITHNNAGQERYKNFRAALYIRALETAHLKGDITAFTEKFERIAKFAKIGKVYIETHRDMQIPEESTLIALKAYFAGKGIAVSAGITVTIDESDDFKTYCYSDPFYRNKLKDIVTLSARHFDEVVFDDFFFSNCKCPKCIDAKGEKSWTQFRLELMTQASKELVLAPARAANPKVEVVIKYPNWYDHFQGLGFNLKDQPPLYEGIYTGNETRDAAHGAQHLQPYESYQVFRYYENIKPGGNRGGWVDPYGSPTLDRYAEQLWLTLFAKSPEITLFDFSSIQTPIRESQRGNWQGQATSFSYDGTTATVRNSDGSFSSEATMAVAAGAALEKVDGVLGELGNPVGVKVYKPYQSMGEDFLVNYLGMVGLPIDMVPEFPVDAATILLTENAKCDAGIVEKIKKQLMDGKNVIITTGLLAALQDRGLKDIVELERTNRKMTTDEFQIGWNPTTFKAEKPLLVPVVEYLTNDSWEIISCNCGDAGTPMLHAAAYGNGKLYILTVPDNFDDLYNLPAGVLSRIGETVAKELYVRLDAPSKVSLFAYDNDTFIVHSFRDETVDLRLVLDEGITAVKDLFPEPAETSGFEGFFGAREPAVPKELYEACEIPGIFGKKSGKNGVGITVKPHSFRVFRCVR